MNANQLINMVMRIVMRQVIGRGVRAGMDAAGNKLSKPRRAQPAPRDRVADNRRDDRHES